MFCDKNKDGMDEDTAVKFTAAVAIDLKRFAGVFLCVLLLKYLK